MCDHGDEEKEAAKEPCGDEDYDWDAAQKHAEEAQATAGAEAFDSHLEAQVENDIGDIDPLF